MPPPRGRRPKKDDGEAGNDNASDGSLSPARSRSRKVASSVDRSNAGSVASMELLDAPMEQGSRTKEATVKATSEASASAKTTMRPPRVKVYEAPIVEMKEITTGIQEMIIRSVTLPPSTMAKLFDYVGRYESLLMRQIARNEYLRGELDGRRHHMVATNVAPVAPSTNASVSTYAGVTSNVLVQNPRPVPAPVGTWTTIVRDKSGKCVGKELAEKVTKEVGPTLGVRVHETRPLKDGGVAIRTPSVAERNRVVENEKLKEMGLEVSTKDKLGARISIASMEKSITPDVLMKELKEKNFASMSEEEFSRSVRILTKPWDSKEDGSINVMLECKQEMADQLICNGRAYVLWFGLQVRPVDEIQACYRCLGFDHRARECRAVKIVCRRCGQDGHRVGTCPNPMNCRNCALKGKPSGHLMMSEACPGYALIVARARARH